MREEEGGRGSLVKVFVLYIFDHVYKDVTIFIILREAKQPGADGMDPSHVMVGRCSVCVLVFCVGI